MSSRFVCAYRNVDTGLWRVGAIAFYDVCIRKESRVELGRAIGKDGDTVGLWVNAYRLFALAYRYDHRTAWEIRRHTSFSHWIEAARRFPKLPLSSILEELRGVSDGDEQLSTRKLAESLDRVAGIDVFTKWVDSLERRVEYWQTQFSGNGHSDALRKIAEGVRELREADK